MTSQQMEQYRKKIIYCVKFLKNMESIYLKSKML